jgi:hypothetical protein
VAEAVRVCGGLLGWGGWHAGDPPLARAEREHAGWGDRGAIGSGGRPGEPERVHACARSILTTIYLCHACSCQEIVRVEAPGQAAGSPTGDSLEPEPEPQLQADLSPARQPLDDIAKLRAIFAHFDEDGDEFLSDAEFQKFAHTKGLAPADLPGLYRTLVSS